MMRFVPCAKVRRRRELGHRPRRALVMPVERSNSTNRWPFDEKTNWTLCCEAREVTLRLVEPWPGGSVSFFGFDQRDCDRLGLRRSRERAGCNRCARRAATRLPATISTAPSVVSRQIMSSDQPPGVDRRVDHRSPDTLNRRSERRSDRSLIARSICSPDRRAAGASISAIGYIRGDQEGQHRGEHPLRARCSPSRSIARPRIVRSMSTRCGI